MSIRMIAQELYRLVREVRAIEKQILDAPAERQEELKDRLRKARAERDRMRASLDAKKE